MSVKKRIGKVEDRSGENGIQRHISERNDAKSEELNHFTNFIKMHDREEMRGGIMGEEESTRNRLVDLRGKESRHELIHRSTGSLENQKKRFQGKDIGIDDDRVPHAFVRVGRKEGLDKGTTFVLVLLAMLVGAWTDNDGSRFLSYFKNKVSQNEMALRGANHGKLVESALSARFIVRFRFYKQQNILRDVMIQDAKFKACGLRWIERENPAARNFPTDFGLVEHGGSDLTPEHIMVSLIWPT